MQLNWEKRYQKLFVKNNQLKRILFSSLVLITSIITLFFLFNEYEFADEIYHFSTIKEVSKFEITEKTFSRNATLPGYTILIGVINGIFSNESLGITRVFSSIFSLIGIFIFYKILTLTNSKMPLEKTLQFFLFPLIFIFSFLIYTDIFSLFLLLSSFLLILKKKYFFSSVFSLISLFVRQINLIYIVFFIFFEYYETFKFKINLNNIRFFIKKSYSLFLPIVIFFIFVFINGGVSIGDIHNDVQPISFRLENVFFFLFLYFFSFIPDNIINFPKIVKLLKKRLFLAPLMFVIYFIFVFTFKVDHPWNSSSFNFYLRNLFLNYTNDNFLIKSITFIPICYSILSLIVLSLKRKSFYLFYPFAFLYLCTFWLIEPRYYIPFFAFLFIFKKDNSRRIELITIFIYFLLSVFLFYGTIERLFFI